MRLFILCSFLLFCSCKSSVEQKIVGFYSINEMVVNQKSVLTDLAVNTIDFDDSGECMMPPLRCSSTQKYRLVYGTWNADSVDSTVTIESEHSIFNGVFNVRFEKNYEKKLLVLILENDGIYCNASKALQNFKAKKDNW